MHQNCCKKIDGVGDAGLVGDDLLGAEGDALGVVRGEGEGFVEAAQGDALDATDHGREVLDCGAHDVVLRLLRHERAAAGLCVRAQHHRARIFRAVLLLEQARPEAPDRAVLGDLFEEVVVGVEDPADAGGEFVDREAAFKGRVHIGTGVGEAEADLLGGRAARIADVVSAHADRVPLGHVFRAIDHDVGGEADARAGGIDVGAPRDILLEHVVLDRAVELVRGNTLLLGGDDVHREHDGGGRVDRHARRDFVEGDVLEQCLHVVEGIDGDADLADFGDRHGVVAVVAKLRREVERDGEAGLALAEEVAEFLVRFLGGAEASVLAHRPVAAAVHRGLDAAREGVFAREAEIAFVVEVSDIERSVKALHGLAAGGEGFVALGLALERLRERPLFPGVDGARQGGERLRGEERGLGGGALGHVRPPEVTSEYQRDGVAE